MPVMVACSAAVRAAQAVRFTVKFLLDVVLHNHIAIVSMAA